MLPVVPAIGAAFLRPVRRVVRAVQIQQNLGGDACLPALTQKDRPQGLGQSVAVPGGKRVLETGEGRLAGQLGIGLRQAATDQLQERIVAQGVRIVLVGVAGGYLVEPLLQQIEPRVSATAAARLRHRRGQGHAVPYLRIRLRYPAPAAVTRQTAALEIDGQRQADWRGKHKRGCGRLGHAGHLRDSADSAPSEFPMDAPLSRS